MDGWNEDGVVGDGSGGDGNGGDSVISDGESGDGERADGDSAGDSGDSGDVLGDGETLDAGPPRVPKGCSSDQECAILAVAQCVVATCNVATGLCQLDEADNGTSCLLSDVCIVNPTCKSGACSGIDNDCDDQNSCTADTCVAFVGCAYAAIESSCNDGDACTLADACTDTQCKGIVRDCTALQPCKLGVCVTATGDCDFAGDAKSGAGCDDNNPCTSGDDCDGKGGCSGVEIDAVAGCDDNNPCTRDICDKAVPGGCAHLAVAGAKSCSDGDACTDDACKDGACVSVKVSCDDFKPCTSDVCKAAANGVDPSCENAPLNTGSCLDSEPCAAVATCSAGTCVVTKKRVCNDNNPCTKDSCEDKNGGCLFLPQNGPCNDGSGCTSADTCKGGACAGVAKDCGDGDLCTLDTCDPATAKCSNPLAPEGYVCANNKTCKGGVCQ